MPISVKAGASYVYHMVEIVLDQEKIRLTSSGQLTNLGVTHQFVCKHDIKMGHQPLIKEITFVLYVFDM